MNTRIRHTISLAGLLVVITLTAPFVHAENNAPLSALLVTGQNNHNWQLSSPILKTILEDADLFRVDMATTPPEGEDMSAFTPAFSAYDVVVLDYTGDRWPEETNAAFLDYVTGGGGVVVIHAANNAFPDWPEYNEIIGLGGWGGRNENHGPYVRWRDGLVVHSMAPGPGGAHGRQHRFVVTHRDTTHPVTNGLPETWLHEMDELYHHLRGPAKNMTLLATAWSDPKTGGTGEHEPVLFTVDYGKGRMFQTTLGHAGNEDPPPAFQCAGFIVTLQRGAEWAATGAVTQPVPDDFPTEDAVKLRPRFKHDVLGDLMDALSRYQYNDSLETLVALEELARKRLGAGASLDDLESAYLALLESEDATSDARFFACKQLSIFGGPKTLPVVSRMLYQPDTAYMARYVLERFNDGRSLTILREALSRGTPAQRAGIIGALAARGDTLAVPQLSAHIHDANEDVARAAIRALGVIGTEQAAEILLAAVTMKEGDLRALAADAVIQAGFTLLRAHRTALATDVFDRAFALLAFDPALQAAALRGRLAVAGGRRGDVLLETLHEGDPSLRAVAAAEVRTLRDNRSLKAITELLPDQTPEVRALLLAALGETPVRNITPLLIQSAQAEEEEVRLAALRTLGTIGDASATVFLLQRATETAGQEQALARQALSRLPGAAPALLEQLAGDVALRQETLLAVVARRMTEAAPLLLEQFADADAEYRILLLQTLAQVADTAHLDLIVPLLLENETSSDSTALVDVVATVAERADTESGKTTALLNALATETASGARVNLYTALGRIATSDTLTAFEQGLKEQDPAVRMAVVEALASWPSAEAADLLRKAVELFRDSEEGAAALSGYIRAIGLEENRDPDETVALYESALALSDRVEDRQACIAAIGRTGNDAALPLLYNALGDGDATVVLAAVRALGQWPNAIPMTRLEILAKDGETALRREALRGYFRLIGLNEELSQQEAAEKYREALTLTDSTAEQKRVMAGLATAETPAALSVVAEYLSHSQLKTEAEVAAVRIAAAVAGHYPAQTRHVMDELASGTRNAFVRGEIAKIRAALEGFQDYITAWEVAGPYTLDAADLTTLFETPFPPEQRRPREPVAWRNAPVGTNSAMPFLVELDKIMGGTNRVAYLRAHIRVDDAMDARLEIGSDDGNKAWLNGALVHEHNAARPVAPGQDVAEVSLKKGWNTLLLKVTQGGGEWSACARLRTPEGDEIPGLRAATIPE